MLEKLYLNREEAWGHVAAQLGGTYNPGALFEHEELAVEIPPWTLTLCPDTSQPLLQTICTARYSPRVPLWLLLEREGGGTQLFLSHPEWAPALFELPGYREAVLSERFTLELRRGQLRCQMWGAVAEPKRLIQLIELVAETLQRLRDLGLVEG